MQLDKYVRSFANGRLRIRHPALVGLSADEYKTIETIVLTVEGITSVQLNPSLGSALLLWDPLRLDAETLKGHLQNWLVMVDGANEVLAPAKKLGQTALDRAAKMLVPEVKNTKRARRMAQNRIMLGLGSASVASLVFNKTGHGYLGWGFAAFVLLHLWQHRRVL